MKKAMMILVVVLIGGLLFVGCSKNNPIAPTADNAYPGGTQRPEFIDNRPAAVIQAFQVVNCEPVQLDPNAAKGAKYALCIGISDYDGTANDLNYCDDDANDWAAFLQSKGYTVTKLIDVQATKSAIESAVNTLAAQSIAGNEIYFVYSGHGYKGNMISRDLYYLSYTWMTSKFSAATSTKMSFTLDACNIGYFVSLAKTGRVVAMASGKTNYSYDGDASMRNGVFTYYQMVGWSSYNYVEGDNDYACTQMIAWGKANRVRCTPTQKDMYTGNLLP